MADIISQAGVFKPGLVASTFVALVTSIIHQQLSMKAAQTITRRVKALCPRSRLSVKALAGLKNAQLRSAGLSKQKVSYVKSICEHFANGTIKTAQLKKMPDQAVIEKLVDIRGVGVWTAEMILIFNLQRMDVWPVDDLGLRNALKKWYRIPPGAKRDRLIRCGEKFRPYRSIATWYLWRSLGSDIIPGF